MLLLPLLNLPALTFLPTLPLTHSLRHNTLSVHPPKALNLLRQARVTPLWPRHLASHKHFPLEFPVKRINKLLPPTRRLSISKVCKNPLTLLLDIRLDHLSKPHAGVAADLLNAALVERGDGLLVAPVSRRRVEEDALAVLFVGEFDNEFVLLVRRGAVGEALEAAGDELCAVSVSEMAERTK